MNKFYLSLISILTLVTSSFGAWQKKDTIIDYPFNTTPAPGDYILLWDSGTNATQQISILTLDERWQGVNTHLTDLSDGSLGGAKVGLADAGGYFATDNAEAVLQKLGSQIPLTDISPHRAIIRINNPDDYQIRLTHEIPLSIRASNQPDGSSPITAVDVVHPSVLHFPSPWRGWQWWMCITPYPGSDATYENPSIMVSHDGLNWIEAPGGQNPIAPYPVGSDSQGDSSLAYDPEMDRLVVVYMRTFSGGREFKQTYSQDGITWSTPSIALSFVGASVVGSPSLVRYINASGLVRWRLYYNGNTASTFGPEYVESTDSMGVSPAWSASAVTDCVISGLGTNRTPWDFQMFNLPGGQWLYCPTISYGTFSAATRPVLGTSDDGITFSCGGPLVRRSQSGEIGFSNIVYTTTLVPSYGGATAFRAFVSGLRTGTGWRLAAGDVTLKPKGLVSGSEKVFEFNTRYNLSPASGALTSVAAMTPEGALTASINAGSTKASRGTDGITFSAVDQYLNWATPHPVTAYPEFTAICRFRPLADPAVATGQRTVFIIRDFVVEIRPLGGNWQIFVRQLSDSFSFVPQLIVPYTSLITIAVSWDGTVARFGSSLTHDYGGYYDSTPSSVAATGDIWIGGGTNSGAPGGLLIDKLLIFDKATTENLDGLATSFNN